MSAGGTHSQEDQTPREKAPAWVASNLACEATTTLLPFRRSFIVDQWRPLAYHELKSFVPARRWRADKMRNADQVTPPADSARWLLSHGDSDASSEEIRSEQVLVRSGDELPCYDRLSSVISAGGGVIRLGERGTPWSMTASVTGRVSKSAGPLPVIRRVAGWKRAAHL